MKIDGPELVRAMAVPFNESAVIAEMRDGERRLYREVFDRNSFASVPDQIPFVRAHVRNNPLGWTKLRLTDRGLLAEVHLVATTGAKDALTEIKARLMTAVSIGFLEDTTKDDVSRAPGELPLVRRRGVELHELSLVSRGAYRGAVVTEITRLSWQSQDSEAIMAPWRKEREAKLAEQHAQSQRLLFDVLAVCRAQPLTRDGQAIPLNEPRAAQNAGGSPTMPGTIETARVVDLGAGVQITVAAEEQHEAERLAHAYVDGVVMALRAKGSALSGTELDQIRAECRVLV